MFIESAVEEFSVNCSIKSCSKRTIKSYRNNLTRFFSLFSEKEIEQIDSAKIKQQISELQNKGLKGDRPRTNRRYVRRAAGTSA